MHGLNYVRGQVGSIVYFGEGHENVVVVFAVSEGKQRMRKRAVHALNSHTAKSIDNLKKDEDEMLRGTGHQ